MLSSRSSCVQQVSHLPKLANRRAAAFGRTRCGAQRAGGALPANDDHVQRRIALLGGGALVSGFAGLPALAQPTFAPTNDDFTVSGSGLRYLDIKLGSGAAPKKGDRIVVHWSGYTSGYQGKRIDNTSVRDEPYEFVLGGGQAIKAFEEAVSSMAVGGLRRVEVPGDFPELSYPRNRSERFTSELFDSEQRVFRYRLGPQPAELGGQRALDFVLDNQTLQDFNRTLLFDIRLLAIRPGRA